ncbi:hypothetical protein GINT2_000296 [Glugoides intestinalis]
MINENHGNLFFGMASVGMLLASIKHSEYISENLALTEEFYFASCFGIVVTCLFVNICLGIFALFVVGNLCDYIQQMAINLIGSRQKLRILAILIAVCFVFYSPTILLCFMRSIVLSSFEKKVVFISFLVSALQLCTLFSISLIHPDIFGLKWRREVREYQKAKVIYL